MFYSHNSSNESITSSDNSRARVLMTHNEDLHSQALGKEKDPFGHISNKLLWMLRNKSFKE